MLTHPLLAENSLFKLIGEIFHPLFELFGLILAGLYAVWPNYGFAITGLTVIIMLALTPVTVKSTKSMLAMQRLQPEMKKLQAKYKGPENREDLNREMMRLYKENGTSPFGACLPSLLQMPFLIVLYTLIRGLSTTVSRGQHVHQRIWPKCSLPESRMRRSEIYPDKLSNVPRSGGEPGANALVVRDGSVGVSTLKSHDESVHACRDHEHEPVGLDHPVSGAHCRCNVPAVLPNEADE